MIFLTGAILLAAAGLATAETTASARTDNPVVCKKDRSYQTGSHMRRPPVCRLKSDWKLEEQEAQRKIQQLRERGPRTQPAAPTAGGGGGPT